MGLGIKRSRKILVVWGLGIMLGVSAMVWGGAKMLETEETRAASASIIDISQDLADGASGNDWTYDIATNTITLLGNGVTLTGAVTNATTRLDISGDFDFALDGFHYQVANSRGVRILGNEDQEITITNSNSITTTCASATSSMIALVVPIDYPRTNPITLVGSGTLSLTGNDDGCTGMKQGVNSSRNWIFAGPTLNIEIGKSASASAGASLGLFATGGRVEIYAGEVNINIGNSEKYIRAFDLSHSSLRLYGGEVNLSVGTNNDATNSGLLYSKNGFTSLPTSYEWGASGASDGAGAVLNTFPGTAFVFDADDKYLSVKAMNTAPNLSITSPVDGTWFSSFSGKTISGTITDPDVNIWQLRVGLSDDDGVLPSEWVDCGSQKAKAFSCGLDELAADEGEQYLFVGVNDGNSGGWVYETVTIGVDSVAPTDPELLFDAYMAGTWTNAIGVEVDLVEGVDATSSAVSYWEFTGDGAMSETIYAGPLVISAEGETEVSAYTMDTLGNESGTAMGVVKIDRTEPVVSWTKTSGDELGNGRYAAPPVTIEIEGVDPAGAGGVAGSGVERIEYGWVEPGEACVFSETIYDDVAMTELPAVAGGHSLCMRAYDLAGNVSAESSWREEFAFVEMVKSLTDAETGIKVELIDVNDGGFFGDNVLKVAEVDIDERDFGEYEDRKLKVYDIEICTWDGVCVGLEDLTQMGGVYAKVTIPLGTLADSHENFGLLYFGMQGGAEQYESTVVDGNLVFLTNHFSEWGIYGSLKVDGGGAGAGDIGGVPGTGYFGGDGGGAFVNGVAVMSSVVVLAGCLGVVLRRGVGYGK